MMQRWLTTGRWGLLVAALLAALCWVPARGLVFDQSIETMFADDDPLVPAWRKFQQLFGGQEVLLAACVFEEPLSPATLPRLQQLSDELRAAAPGVRVQSLAGTPLATGIFSDIPAARRLRELLTDYLIGRDGRTAAVVCVLPSWRKSDADSPGAHRAAVVRKLQTVIERYPLGTLAGEPVMLVHGFRLLEEDGSRLETISMALIAATLWLCFRSWRWVLIPWLLVWLILLITRALLAVSDIRMTMVSSMLSAMLTIVGTATVVHLIVRYQALRTAGYSGLDALAKSVRVLWLPICGAIATDLIGFGALGLSRVGPVHDFGLMIALGTALVIPIGAILIPGIVLWREPEPAQSTSSAGNDSTLQRGLGALWPWLYRYWRWGVPLIFGVVIFGLSGLPKIVVETDFTRNFRDDSDLVRAYELVETRLGGAGVWDLLLPVPAEMGPDDWNRLRNLEQELRAIRLPGDELQSALTKVLSLVDVLDALSPVDLRTLPDNVLTRVSLNGTISLLNSQLPDLAASLSTVETTPQGTQRWMRIMLRSKERMPADVKLQVIESVRRAAAGWMTNEQQPQLTGFYVLLAGLINSLQSDQWLTFSVAAAGILFLLTIWLHSPVLALFAVTPNLLAILLLPGIIGWCGLRANMGTVMIAAISMGLAVDASIHFLAAYRRQRAVGNTVHQALIAVETETGPAMIWATLALIVGFSSLCTSRFVPTIHFGALSSLTMLSGMLGNLIVLPWLVWLWEGRPALERPPAKSDPLGG